MAGLARRMTEKQPCGQYQEHTFDNLPPSRILVKPIEEPLHELKIAMGIGRCFADAGKMDNECEHDSDKHQHLDRRKRYLPLTVNIVTNQIAWTQ